RLADSVRPITRTERITLVNAAGRVAATDLASPGFVPPFSRSAMDGYAVVAADTAGATRERPRALQVIERVFTGQTPTLQIRSGECAEIATGAPLPAGADAVVMVEDTTPIVDGRVGIANAATPGQNIGRRGADISPGDLVVRAGDLLNPSRIGA